jgi:hypothetical protein
MTRLSGLISSIWRRSNTRNSSFIQLDRTPTGAEEAAAFVDPSRLLSDLKNRDYEQDISLRRNFARFALLSSGVWIVFLILITVWEGTGGTEWMIFHIPVFVLPPFHLQQWAFVGVCGSSTATVLGLSRLVAKYLFPASRTASQDEHKRSQNQRRRQKPITANTPPKLDLPDDQGPPL